MLSEFHESGRCELENLAPAPDEKACSKAINGAGPMLRASWERCPDERLEASELHLDESLIHPSTGEVYQRPRLPGIEPGELSMYGIVDSVLEEPDGLLVVDYKVTARTSADSSVMLTHRMQLLCYAWPISRASDKPVKALEIRQLVRKKQPDISVTRAPVPANISFKPMFNAINDVLACVNRDTFLARYGFTCHATCEGYGLSSTLA